MPREIRLAPRKLTDAMAEKVKPVDGLRTVYADKEIPGLELRVAPDGTRVFALLYRAKGDPTKHRIVIGDYPTVKLAAAREAARKYRIQARSGEDPRLARSAAIDEAKRQRSNTFASVAEDFIKEHVSKLRSKSRTEAEIRRHLMPFWGTHPIAKITADDAGERIQAIINAGTPHMARLILAHAKRLFRWAAAPGRPNRLKSNPFADIKAKDFDIKNVSRQVILSGEHLRYIWKATEALTEPFGPFVKALLLTGQRRNEIACLRWSEINMDERVIVLPAERMKAGKPHEIPICQQLFDLLKRLKDKRGQKGDYVFSTTLGLAPISGFSKAKVTLDKEVAAVRERELKAASEKGVHTIQNALQGWCFHDLRRTVRTGLGGIPGIPHDIRELVIAHVPSALVRTYDLHAYREEKRAALEAWNGRLMRIIEPVASENVVSIKRHFSEETPNGAAEMPGLHKVAAGTT